MIHRKNAQKSPIPIDATLPNPNQPTTHYVEPLQWNSQIDFVLILILSEAFGLL